MTSDALLGSKLRYTGRVRRTARSVGRAIQDLACPATYPSAPIVRAYWWEEKKNFGDLLTPLVLRRLGVIAVRAPIESADVVGVGSLLQQLPREFSGTLWGTGQIQDEPLDLPFARPVALRGELTRDRLGAPHVTALGDPGLLVRRFLTPPPKRHDLGVVVHYAHQDDAHLVSLLAAAPHGTKVIGVQRAPLAVARDIAGCRTILTTSLHGLIMADAFGIPALWVRASTPLYGGDFKFLDHETVARPSAARGLDAGDLTAVAGIERRAVCADGAAIDEACERLAASVRTLVEVAARRRASPLALPALRA